MATILVWPKCPICPIKDDRASECECEWIDVQFRRAAKIRLPLGVRAPAPAPGRR
jgi:hypothetical protein